MDRFQCCLKLFLAIALLSTSACGSGAKGGEEAAPLLYTGPIAVTTVTPYGLQTTNYSNGSKSRTSQHTAGGWERIYDYPSRKMFSWRTGIPGVSVTKLRSSAPPKYWSNRPYAKRGESCSAAGEMGNMWRFTTPPFFKNPQTLLHQACITADGVILKLAVAAPPGTELRLEWEATAIVRGPLPAEVFAPPLT